MERREITAASNQRLQGSKPGRVKTVGKGNGRDGMV